MLLTVIEDKDGQGYPEIRLMAGTEHLATVHHLGNDRNKEWRQLAQTLSHAEPMVDLLDEFLAAKRLIGQEYTDAMAEAMKKAQMILKAIRGAK